MYVQVKLLAIYSAWHVPRSESDSWLIIQIESQMVNNPSQVTRLHGIKTDS